VRSDIWSLGVVLHELLSGSRPFKGESVAEMCSAVLVEDPAPLSIGVPVLEQVVARCLAKEPEDRYQRVPELARDLAPFAADPEAANALVDRMDRVAGRPSAAIIARAPTAPTARDRAHAATAPALVAAPAVATTHRKVPRRTAMIAIAATALVAGGVTFALTRSTHTPPATMVPRPGGTLRVAMNRPDETHLALYAGQPTRTQAALRMILERLVVIDAAGQPQQSVLAGLEPRDQGKQLVLTLRDNVKFHDTPCMPSAFATAEDVKFSIEEAIALHQLDLDIEDMVAKGLELTIKMKTPAVSFAHVLSHVWLVPAKLESCEPDRKALKHPVGSGPFRYVPSPVTSTVTLAKWDHYWRTDARGAPLPYLDRVELVKVVEASVALAGLHADLGSPQALHVFIPSEPLKSKLVDHAIPKLIGDGTAGLELGTRTNQGDVGLWLLEVTPEPGPLHDHAQLRHALALAIDRAAAVKEENKRASSPARPYGRFLPPEALGHDRTTKPIATDLSRARQLIANLPPIRELVIGYSHDEKAATAIAQQLTSIGLTIKLEKIELRDQSAVVGRGDGIDAMLISRWGKVLGDELVSIGAYDQLRTTGTRQLLAELASKSARAERAAVYKQIEETLLAELPSIPIATLDPSRVTFVTIVRKEVEGFHDRATGFVPHDDGLTFAETWLRATP
jgi:ABC-type transport system substrate-binding protein